jgi:small-conductance mechanosensitive channel
MTPFEITLLTFILIQILIFFCYKFTVSKLKRKNKPFRAFLLACYLSISFLLLSFYLELYDVSFFMNHKKNIHLITSFFISFTVIRFLKSFIWNGKIISRGKLIPKIITKVFHSLIYFIALAITLNFVFNQSITPYLAISGATAAFIGFIAKDGISQILAGLSINLAKNINKGNYIMIGKNGDVGKIIEMDWRSVTLRLKTGPLLIIPNNILTTSKIINFSATKKTCLAQSYFYFPGYIHSQKIINILKYTFKQLKLEKTKCSYYIKRNENNYCLKIYHPANSTDIMTEKSNFIELYSHNLYKSGIYFDTLTRLNDLSKQSLKLDNNQQLDINKIKKIPFIKTLS